MKDKKIVLLGTGGQARETLEYAQSAGVEVAFWSVSEQYRPAVSPVKFVALEDLTEANRGLPALCAVGAPRIKYDLVQQWKGGEFLSLLSPSADIGTSSTIGEGVTIAPRVVITSTVHVGSHVLINVAATINHDSKVGDYCTLGPGVHIGGNVTIGQGTVIGIGATIKHGVTIGENVYIGAGSVVIKDIPDNVVAFGVPAEVQRTRQGWIDEL